MFSETKAAAVTCAIIKPELMPGSGVRNAGKPDRARIDQQRDAPLRQRSDLADRQRQDIGREGDRLAVEVAAGQDFAGLGE